MVSKKIVEEPEIYNYQNPNVEGGCRSLLQLALHLSQEPSPHGVSPEEW